MIDNIMADFFSLTLYTFLYGLLIIPLTLFPVYKVLSIITEKKVKPFKTNIEHEVLESNFYWFNNSSNKEMDRIILEYVDKTYPLDQNQLMVRYLLFLILPPLSHSIFKWAGMSENLFLLTTIICHLVLAETVYLFIKRERVLCQTISNFYKAIVDDDVMLFREVCEDINFFKIKFDHRIIHYIYLNQALDVMIEVIRGCEYDGEVADQVFDYYTDLMDQPPPFCIKSDWEVELQSFFLSRTMSVN